MQSVDGDEDEQPSSSLQSHVAGGESTQMDRPAASKHSVANLPPLVPDDKELETEELKRFREQWRTELKREQSAEPGTSSSPQKAKEIEDKKFLRAAEEWKLQRELDRRNVLQISREDVEPLPFAVPADELAIQALAAVESLHLGSIPDEVLVYLLCFLDEVSLVRLALSCKKTYSLSREPVLWRLICQRIWGHNCSRAVYHQFGTWQRMFMTRPKVRYDGLFVSKNTYLRAGSTEWAYNQPVHQVTYYRYLRLMPDGRLLYAMALEPPRKVLKWFNPRTLEQERERERTRDKHAQHTHYAPSPGTYTLDDVSGAFEMWVQGKDMTQQFACVLRRKLGGRFIAISVNKYMGTSKTGVTTDYDSVPIAPFHFFKLATHILDPVHEQK